MNVTRNILFLGLVSLLLGQKVVVAQVATRYEGVDSIAVFADEILAVGKVWWGLKAGVNYTNLHGKDIDYLFSNDESAYKVGFQAGVFVRTTLNKRFALGHELMFSQRKFGVSLADDGGDYSSRIAMQSIVLTPINLNYAVGPVRVYAGPYVSTLLHADIQRKEEDGTWFKDKQIYGSAGDDESENKYLQKMEMGFNGGIAWQLNRRFLLGLNYMQGLSSMFQYASSYDVGDSKDRIRIYNRGFSFSLAYTL
ncbi:porin family protein [Sphingobacterium tabacisoli]|uniref:Porin family protein n=1 Tax=Sphingobacterium tabacisoli TaxID=2044855 RepID=A0ABW5L4T5_9SPHI|nr:porin family protein [Sphingobacterium tabacisoli]